MCDASASALLFNSDILVYDSETLRYSLMLLGGII